MSNRRFCLASLLLAGVILTATLIIMPVQHGAILDRLAPRIERTSALAPETRAIILELIRQARESQAPEQRVQRRHDIDHIAAALN